MQTLMAYHMAHTPITQTSDLAQEIVQGKTPICLSMAHVERAKLDTQDFELWSTLECSAEMAEVGVKRDEFRRDINL